MRRGSRLKVGGVSPPPVVRTAGDRSARDFEPALLVAAVALVDGGTAGCPLGGYALLLERGAALLEEGAAALDGEDRAELGGREVGVGGGEPGTDPAAGVADVAGQVQVLGCAVEQVAEVLLGPLVAVEQVRGADLRGQPAGRHAVAQHHVERLAQQPLGDLDGLRLLGLRRRGWALCRGASTSPAGRQRLIDVSEGVNDGLTDTSRV